MTYLQRMGFDVPSTIRAWESDQAGDHRVLVVIGPDELSTVALPSEGQVTIGRSPENEVCLDDGLISRQHARIHLGANVEIEDLGSANGTRVGQEVLRTGERRALVSGALIDVGSTILVYQVRGRPLVSRRLWSHGYFEARLEEECRRLRAGATAPLALIRAGLSGVATKEELERALTKDLRPGDLVASYAANEFELLLLDANRSRAERVANAIKDALSNEERRVDLGIAVFPEDGASAQALMSRATELLFTPEPGNGSPVIVADPAMRDLYRIVERVAAGTISVLLLGETGVGKEVVAEAIHARSKRREGPFVRINCAAIAESVVESELFGFEKGAFTGADQARAGLIEAANGGTIFFDEVGELPLATQAKLLRSIEQREVLRVGSIKPRPVDVRIVSATNRNLEDEIGAGRFRQDLYFRISGVTLEVPPLRRRALEIEPLAKLFVSRSCEQLGIEPLPLSPQTVDLLRDYAWPGNIRELKNVMERAALLASGESIEPIDLPFEKLSVRWAPEVDCEPDDEERALRDRILQALEACAGNQTRAAQQLGFSRQTLSKWITRFGIRRPKKGRA
jgi:two-component system, NtrC family, response regulator AtoC